MLSYCTNIHPAESWAETREALFTCVPRIRQELAAMDSPLKDIPLGIGLRQGGSGASGNAARRGNPEIMAGRPGRARRNP